LKKDPGIPNLYPYKEQFLNQMKRQEEKDKAQHRHDSIMGKKRKREEATTFEEMQQDVVKRQRIHEENNEMLGISDTLVKDNSRKSFYKEFKDVVKGSDVIIEVLDARDPIGTRSVGIEKQILRMDPNKRIVLVLNKIDLIPKSNLEDWLSYLRNYLPTVAFKASTQKQKKNRGMANQSALSDDIAGISECLGADNLLQLLKNYCRSFDTKKSITVGIIGFPNVGKSSLINSLKRSKVVNVGAIPGVTKTSQTIVLDKQISLLDCPGIIFDPGLISASDAALRNCIKFEQIEDPLLPVEAILRRCSRENLMELYKIGTFANATQFLSNVAIRRGRVRQGGVGNIDEAAKIILTDWNTGKIPYYTIPPKQKHLVSAEIVSQYSEEFNLDSVMEIERDMLEGLSNNDYGFNSFQSDPLTMDMEDMDVESSEDDQPQVVVSIKKKNPKQEKTSKITRVDDGINPQLNKDMKEIIKKRKEAKDKEKGNEVLEEENFDFGTDFWGNHQGEIVEEDVDGFTF